METAVTPQQLFRRIGSLLLGTTLALLGLFGAYFSFANYPWFGALVVLLILLLVAHSERKRRATQEARDTARRRERLDA